MPFSPRGASTLFLATLLAGCASVPRLAPSPAPANAAALGSERSLSGPVADWPQDNWWVGFDDPALTALIEEGLRDAPDIWPAPSTRHTWLTSAVASATAAPWPDASAAYTDIANTGAGRWQS